VSRVYGGQLSHSVVKERIVRAFLIEEQKIVKRVRFVLFRVVGWGARALLPPPPAAPPPPPPAQQKAASTLKKQLSPLSFTLPAWSEEKGARADSCPTPTNQKALPSPFFSRVRGPWAGLRKPTNQDNSPLRRRRRPR
jgi:hypothetical protein